MTEPTNLYKLMLLYMLNRVSFSLTNSQLSDFLLEREYTSYFTLQSVLSEMTQAQLIHVETLHNNSYYTITPDGENVLSVLINEISLPIRKEIDLYLREHKLQLREETAVIADYFRNTTGGFSVRCRIREIKEDPLDLTLNVPDEALAKLIVKNWKVCAENVYASLVRDLMTDSSTEKS